MKLIKGWKIAIIYSIKIKLIQQKKKKKRTELIYEKKISII